MPRRIQRDDWCKLKTQTARRQRCKKCQRVRSVDDFESFDVVPQDVSRPHRWIPRVKRAPVCRPCVDQRATQ